jgi:hypothetical protein
MNKAFAYQFPSLLSGSSVSRTDLISTACLPLMSDLVTLKVWGAVSPTFVTSKVVALPSMTIERTTG